MKLKDTEIKVVQGDITKLKVDAIVNAANNKLVMGGGVAGAIKKNGGKIIEEEAIKKAPIEVGEAVYTGAGTLPAKYVIHAATMGMDFRTDEVKVRASCRSALKVANKLKLKSLGFVALGCGVGGFPFLASAKIMTQEVYRHIRQDQTSLKEISFCLYDKKAYEVFQKGVIKYISHIANEIQAGPFVTVDAIIEVPGGIVLIERSNPPFGYALPGGFVDYGESLEDSVVREAKEETNLDIVDLKQFHTYSKYGRDPRFHTVTAVFTAKGKGTPKAGDDAKGLVIVKPGEIKELKFAFDHKEVLQDYFKFKQGKNPFES